MAKPSSHQNDHSRLENRSLQSRQFKGIRMRKWGKWVSEIRMPNSRDRIWLGSYDTPEKAARAYDFAVYCLRGSKANFNFPYFLSNIPDASSLSPQQIQATAAKFAEQEIWLPFEGSTAGIPYPSSLSLPQIQAAAANAAEEIWLPSEDNAADIPYYASPCPPQIQAAAAKFPAEEFWLPSENNATSSCFCLNAESSLEGQEISVEQGPSSNDSVILEDFPPFMGFSSSRVKSADRGFSNLFLVPPVILPRKFK